MKRFLILFLVVSVILSFIALSLEGIPGQEFSEHPQKIKIFLDIAGDDDLKPLVAEHLLEAFSRTENINAVLEIEKGVSYVVSIVLVEARVGEDKRKPVILLPVFSILTTLTTVFSNRMLLCPIGNASTTSQ